MKDIIINRPDLQSFKQKCSSAFLSVLSWLLWLYFLLPLFTLGGWLLGVKEWADEIRWFGGYKSLLDLLIMYVSIILVIALFWLLWSFCLTWLHARRTSKRAECLSDQQLAQAFHVDESQLLEAKSRQKLTVHFDDHATITNIVAD